MCQPGRCFPARMGHGVPKGSLGKMRGIRGSCEELQGHPWQSQEHPALCTAVDRAVSSPVCCGLAGVPQELHSFWVSFEGLCWWPCDRVGSIPPGRVTRWAEARAGTQPPASTSLPETRGTLTKASACLQISACIRAPAVLSLSPSVPGHAGAGVP